jgi:dTDP-4-dehydrorhamnose 3,5-epimerase
MMYRGEDLKKLPGVKGSPIEGVVMKPLRKLPDERGAIHHMLRSDDEMFESFGEIYFSAVHPGVIKGWHIHQKMTLNYAVQVGQIKMVLYDDRPASSTRGALLEIVTGAENYLLIRVPPMVWNGFKGIGTETALVANCATIPHDPAEIARKDPFTKDIPYDWSLKHG